MVEPEWSPPDEFEEYRLVRLLGRGAMGEVYLAHDSLLDRPVAVKFVQAAEDPVARARFFDEARAIARLHHPNVVAIYRVAEVAGHPYLVSEYVRGRALDQLERPVPWRTVLGIALDLTRGLAAAHRSGVLHRDVKPANAMLTDDGRGKLLDFGLARVSPSEAELDASTPLKEPAIAPPRERTTSARHLSIVDATISSPVRAAAALASSSTSVDSFVSGAVAPSVEQSLGRGSPDEAGTPLYMAPELWRGEPATRRSDLYALGILLYELLAGVAPHRGIPMAELSRAIQNRDIPRLGDVVRDIEPAFATIVDRLVERDAGARWPSADALLVALEDSAAPVAVKELPDGNPYRGLAAFESAHGALFFGRRGEIRELVDRVTSEALVVVGGDSGTGKSSVCRAGVLPWLEEHGGWSRVDIVPGRRPVQTLSAALAAWSGAAEAELVERVRDTPDALARAIRQSVSGDGKKLLLFIDQLEELLTLSEPAEARHFAAAIAALAVRTPAIRVVATGRSDFLSRLAMLPGLGDEMARGLYFLRPLSGDRIREAIVRPAAAKGVTFESDELVDTLVAQTEQAPGGLPLLQFTLAELWDARDVGAKVIRTDSLDAMGGVAGALARHADRLIAALDANGREAARRLLLRLVTAEGTRARRSEDELLTGGTARATERAALEVLVRGRIVVANAAQDGAYEIAHEALLTSWATLQDWRRRGAADHAVRMRVEQAAATWERMGRPRDLLWGRRQLAEARHLDRDSLATREAAFLAAARSAIVRRRVVGAVVGLALGAAAIAIGLAIRARARHEFDTVIAEQTQAAATAVAEARDVANQRDAARARAYALFAAHDWRQGERVWDEVERLAAREASSYRAAANAYEAALALDPANGVLRAQHADLLYERFSRADRDRDTSLVAELAGRLTSYDEGRHRADVAAPARVELTIDPPGASVWLERPGAARALLGQAPLAPLSLPPGGAVFSIEAPGRAPIRQPALLARGQTLAMDLALPAASAVPASMLHVPPGRLLFGSIEPTSMRRGFLNSPPIHEVETGAYLIARREVTFREWIAFLDALSPEERKLRTPRAVTTLSSLELVEVEPKKWRLRLMPTTETYSADAGEKITYPGRKLRATQDWLDLPVAAISFEDAVAYAAWLAKTQRLPGARLCDEHEWERAARGADGRTFPTGATLAPDDANIDITYGRDPLSFGPDEVGSHPISRSPVGADDMAGNVWEWTRSVENPGAPIMRGGAWYNGDLTARADNREHGEPTQRHVLVGLRLCATPSAMAP